MKKGFIKSIAVSLAVLGVIATAPLSVSAAELTTDTSNNIERNIPVYPFYELNAKTTDVTGNNVISQNNLPSAAIELYNKNHEEGAKVVNIINHANYFAQKYYIQDGKARGNIDAYKNNYVGYCLYYYMPETCESWLNALYNRTTFLDSIDMGNASSGISFAENNGYAYSETMIAQYINAKIENGSAGTTGTKEYETATTVRGSKALSDSQKAIKATNYAFSIGVEEDYIKSWKIIECTGFGSSPKTFNNLGDNLEKSIYGALIYLRAKNTGLNMDKARQWVESTFSYDSKKLSMIDYTYVTNALAGFDLAKERNVSTNDEACQAGFDLMNHTRLIHIDSESKWIHTLTPYRETYWTNYNKTPEILELLK